jgi:hypothetical protein
MNSKARPASRQAAPSPDLRLLSWLTSRSFPHPDPECPGLRFTVTSAYNLARAFYGWSNSLWRQARKVRQRLDQLRRRRLLYVTWYPGERPCELDTQLWIILDSPAIERLTGICKSPRAAAKKPAARCDGVAGSRKDPGP